MGDLVSYAALFGIYAALIFDIFSSLTSSPQTTELFAKERADTLWHWVRIGAFVSLIFIAFGAWLAHKEGKDYRAPILGGMVALALMWYLYSHALKKGGGSKPGNEDKVLLSTGST
jgi:uncharacterized membrane protein